MCVCVCVRARVCVCARVRACLCTCTYMDACMYVYNLIYLRILAAESHQEIKIGAYKFGTGFRVILEM